MSGLRQDLKKRLIRRLQDLPLDTRLPSDRQLAAEFGVAFLTAVRAMRELQEEGYVVRRPRQGTFVASRERVVPDDASAPSGAEGAVLIAYPNYFSWHFWRHVRLVEEFAVKNRLRLVELKLTREMSLEPVLALARRVENLRGVLMLPPPAALDETGLAALDQLGKPVVLLSTHVALGARRNLACFNLDERAAGELAISALLAKGHRRVAWVRNEPARPPSLLEGMRAALRAHGLEPGDLIVVDRGIEPWQDSRECGYRLTLDLLDAGVATAAYYDSMGGVHGALRALWERGLKAPEHLSIVSNETHHGEEDYLFPPITTIEWDWQDEMRQAFAIVLGAPAAGPREGALPVRLRERASIVAPRAAKRS